MSADTCGCSRKSSPSRLPSNCKGFANISPRRAHPSRGLHSLSKFNFDGARPRLHVRNLLEPLDAPRTLNRLWTSQNPHETRLPPTSDTTTPRPELLTSPLKGHPQRVPDLLPSATLRPGLVDEATQPPLSLKLLTPDLLDHAQHWDPLHSTDNTTARAIRAPLVGPCRSNRQDPNSTANP